MIGVASVVFLGVLFFVALGFFFHYFGKDATRALWWGIASGVFALVGVGFYVQQFVIQTTKKDDVRGWVVVKAIQLRNSINSGESPFVTIQFTNKGSIPATAKFFYVLRMDEVERRYSDTISDGGQLAPGNSNALAQSKAVLIPDGEYLAEVGWYPPKPISDEEIKYIVSNKLRTQVSGFIEYDDTAGHHTTEFCFINESYDSVRFIACGKYNSVS